MYDEVLDRRNLELGVRRLRCFVQSHSVGFGLMINEIEFAIDQNKN